MKNILITGANGMLGVSLCIYFSKLKSYRVFPTSRIFNAYSGAKNFLVGDLTDKVFTNLLKDLNFDLIIHCAALTDIEECEREPETASLNNVTATENLLESFPETPFMYISTDSVFDGRTGNYTETDTPNPLNVYSRTKLEGENATISKSSKPYILRTNMYGFHRPPSGRSLFEWSFENLSKGNEVRGFSNVIFNPLYVRQIAEVIEKMFTEKIEFGIYNVVCDSPLSKFDFLQKVTQVFGFSENLVLPYKISEKPVNAVRPLITDLTSDKLNKALPGLDLSLNTGFQMLYDDFSEFVK